MVIELGAFVSDLGYIVTYLRKIRLQVPIIISCSQNMLRNELLEFSPRLLEIHYN